MKLELRAAVPMAEAALVLLISLANTRWATPSLATFSLPNGIALLTKLANVLVYKYYFLIRRFL